jgi:hypothetical protein
MGFVLHGSPTQGTLLMSKSAHASFCDSFAAFPSAETKPASFLVAMTCSPG